MRSLHFRIVKGCCEGVYQNPWYHQQEADLAENPQAGRTKRLPQPSVPDYRLSPEAKRIIQEARYRKFMALVRRGVPVMDSFNPAYGPVPKLPYKLDGVGV